MDKDKLIKTVKAAQEGCEKSYNALYIEFSKTVYYTALKVLENKEDAEDITQEVFISVFNEIGNLENPETFPAWVKRITSNKCLNLLTRTKVKVDSDLAELDGVDEFFEDNPLLLPEKYVDNAETSRLIIEVVDKLPLPQRVCIYYYYFEQMTIAQIAEALSAPEGTVKRRLALARDKIRKELEQLEKDEGIKLYGVPLLLTPVLRGAFERFEMPEGLVESSWESISSALSSNTGVVSSAVIAEAGAVTTATTSNVVGGFVMAVKTKIALAVAGVVLVSGVIVGVVSLNSSEADAYIPVETTAHTEAVQTAPATVAVTTFATPAVTAETEPTEAEDPWTDVNQTMYVANDTINVRREADLDSTRLGGLVYRDEVVVTGVSASSEFYRVEFEGGVGYIHASVLTDEQPPVREQTTQAPPQATQAPAPQTNAPQQPSGGGQQTPQTQAGHPPGTVVSEGASLSGINYLRLNDGSGNVRAMTQAEMDSGLYIFTGTRAGAGRIWQSHVDLRANAEREAEERGGELRRLIEAVGIEEATQINAGIRSSNGCRLVNHRIVIDGGMPDARFVPDVTYPVVRCTCCGLGT